MLATLEMGLFAKVGQSFEQYSSWHSIGVIADMDECRVRGVCSANEICENSFGSFSCKCLPGFVQNNGTCVGRRSSGICASVTILVVFKISMSAATHGSYADCTNALTRMAAIIASVLQDTSAIIPQGIAPV
jgi:hypothetical protein